MWAGVNVAMGDSVIRHFEYRISREYSHGDSVIRHFESPISRQLVLIPELSHLCNMFDTQDVEYATEYKECRKSLHS